eukprot:Gb_32739 [translate_table: standard]
MIPIKLESSTAVDDWLSVAWIECSPGPTPLPIIGNLHVLGNLPHISLQALAKKYGPLMYLRLGSVSTVVASSPEMAKEFLKTHDAIFASRPPTSAGKYTAYDCKDMAFAPYGAYRRHIRKVCTLQLLTSKRILNPKSALRKGCDRKS